MTTTACSSPKAAPAAVSSAKSHISNTGGSEGSGLIDIRSMASVYLADKGGAGPASMPAGSADDLPVFSQSAFESAALIAEAGAHSVHENTSDCRSSKTCSQY